MHYDVKESPGGLRDLEMAMLLLKVLYEMEGPVGVGLLGAVAERYPSERQLCTEIEESYQFLNRLRDVYRLTVCPSNYIDPGHFEQPALILGYEREKTVRAGEKLREDFRWHCERSARRLHSLLDIALKR